MLALTRQLVNRRKEMSTYTARTARVLCIAALAVLTACSGGEKAPAAPSTITVAGSSTMLPLTQAAAKQFAENNPEAPEVVVTGGGTRAGFERFCAGETDIADSSRPITTREMLACYRAGVRYIEAPIAFDGVTVIAHASNPVREITLDELRTIWSAAENGARLTWRDINARWPDTPLALYGPGSESGTYDYFTEALFGEEGGLRSDYTASEDDEIIVAGVAGNPSALGFVGYSHFAANKDRLRAIPVNAGDGAVAPSRETIEASTYRPFSRPLFIYVNLASLDREGVQPFVESYIASAKPLSEDMGYVALPEHVYPTYLARVRDRRYGTAFQGRSHVGETIEEAVQHQLVEAAT